MEIIVMFKTPGSTKTLMINQTLTVSEVRRTHFPLLSDAHQFVHGGRPMADNATFANVADGDTVVLAKDLSGN
jgi:hypothetical protein